MLDKCFIGNKIHISSALKRYTFETEFSKIIQRWQYGIIALAYLTMLNRTTVTVLLNFLAGSLRETSNFVQVFATYQTRSTMCCILLKRLLQRFFATTTSFVGPRLLSKIKHFLKGVEGQCCST